MHKRFRFAAFFNGKTPHKYRIKTNYKKDLKILINKR